MHADARKAAQQRVDRIALFKAELQQLETEGALKLTPEQSARLQDHVHALLARLRADYGVDATDTARRVSWGMRVASLLGAAALLAAAILFLHRVWGGLSTPLQVLILTASPLLLLAPAEWLYRREADPYYVGLFGVAALVALIVGMNALGVVLNLAGSPQVLLVWATFALCLAYAYSLKWILAAGLVFSCAWSGALVLQMRGFNWFEFGQTTQFLIPGAAVIYALPWLLGRRASRAPRALMDAPPGFASQPRSSGREAFAEVYRCCGAALGLLSLLIFSLAGDVCCRPLTIGQAAALCQIGGLALSAAVVTHGVRLGSGGLVNLGALGFIAFLFARLHSWWWNWMPKYLFFLSLGLIAFACLVLFRRVRLRLREGGSL